MPFASLWRRLTLRLATLRRSVGRRLCEASPDGDRRCPELRVLVYTRASCHLCDDALAILQSYQKRYGFVLETKDVDESAELAHAHGASVPVVTFDGQVRFRGHVNEALLKRILDANAV